MIRVVGWNVQPVLMSDDGENLIPIQVNLTYIPASEWGKFKHGGDEEALKKIEGEVDG